MAKYNKSLHYFWGNKLPVINQYIKESLEKKALKNMK